MVLGLSTGLFSILLILGLWDAVWKLIGAWKAARNNHLIWFICIAIFNTAGILPIIYVLVFSKKRSNKRKR